MIKLNSVRKIFQNLEETKNEFTEIQCLNRDFEIFRERLISFVDHIVKLDVIYFCVKKETNLKIKYIRILNAMPEQQQQNRL